jgi:hypothetical protein
MWRFLETYRGNLGLRRYRRSLDRALALHLRGEVRRDGLTLTNACNRLEIQWRARDIHPWDRDVPQEKHALLFAEQTLADTEAAIFRLFEALPQVDVIKLSVVGIGSESPIISGTVHRSTLSTARRGLMSVGMRLRDLGVSYHSAGRPYQPSDSDNGTDAYGMMAPARGHGQLLSFR